MAANLSTLPTETLSLILGHFCLHCSKQHDYDSSEGYFRSTAHEQQPDQPSWYSRECRQPLHSMCLVSRRLFLIAQPILHHEFIPGYGDAWRSSHFSWTGRLASLLRTVAARPDLAALLKRIFIHPHLLRAVLHPAAAAPGVVVRLSEYLGPFDEFLRRRIHHRKGASLAGWKLVGALLALVPNLERLSLQVADVGGVPAAAFAALRNNSPPRGSSGSVLSKLETLDVCHRNDGSWLFSLEDCANGVLDAVIAAGGGRLSTLNLHGCRRVGPSNSNGLQTLRLSDSRFADEDLAAALRSCSIPGLKSFFYEARAPLPYFWRSVDTHSGDDHFQPTTAIQLLLPHAPSLTSLHLDLRNRGEAYLSPESGIGWFSIECISSTRTSLSAFPALKHVFLNAAAVCNIPRQASPGTVADEDGDREEDFVLLQRLLPPNVESLCLAASVREGVKDRMAGALVGLASTVAAGRGFTRLRRVGCDVSIVGARVDEVERAFELAGVDLEWRRWQASGPTLMGGEGTPEPELEPPPEYLMDSYNSNAAAYERAAEIQNWYYKNGYYVMFLAPAAPPGVPPSLAYGKALVTQSDGSSSKVQQLFMTETSTTAPSSSSGTDPSGSATTGKEGSSSTSVGAMKTHTMMNNSTPWRVAKPGSPSELSTAAPAYKP
ncbi:hypothetical protein L209DRAFT_782661 [Thermothelomyces heterothallicus CBS 203.75]